MSTFIPILSYFMLNNHTFVLNYEEKGIGYKIDVNDIKIDTVDGWKVKEVEFLPE